MSSEKQIIKAAKSGEAETVKVLLREDPDLIHVEDRDGSTPLHCAAWKGHVEIVALLLDAGAEIDAHNNNGHWGTTALHAASHGSRKAVAELLGITEHITSPTFVIMKSYTVPNHAWIQELVHIDAYRIEDIDEMRVIRLEELYTKEGRIICIEWPERIESLLPKDIFSINISCGEGDTRTVSYNT